MATMKTVDEIVKEALGEDDVVDLGAAIATVKEELGKSLVGAPPANIAMAAFLEAQQQINIYLGQLILSVAAEVNALPNGFDDEMATLEAYVEWAHLSTLYGKIQAQNAAMSGLQIVSGEVPPDLGDLRGEK